MKICLLSFNKLYFTTALFFLSIATELVAFRGRIGEPGVELILQESIQVNDRPKDDNEQIVVSVDSTVQKKNITYPTDDKLYKKIIKKCWKIADKESIDLRQSYTKTFKKLSNQQRFKETRHGAKAARKASKKIKIIAGRLVRELARKLSLERLGVYLPSLKLYQRVLSQKRGDSNKIYSLHEPDVKCYSKGKEHKRFEFGSKASIVVDQATGIIMGAINFTETLHDSKTLPEVLEQYERLNGHEAIEVIVDRGYKGLKTYKASKIYVPKPDRNITKKQRQKHSKRAAIEPVIGHLKQDYRLCRNYLKGINGDNMNVILAAAAMNFKRVMNLWRTQAIKCWLLIYNFIVSAYWNFIAQNLKLTFRGLTIYKGKWYVYFAAESGNNFDHRLYVLENASKDPLQGSWVMKGKLTTPKDKWTIDTSVFNPNSAIDFF